MKLAAIALPFVLACGPFLSLDLPPNADAGSDGGTSSASAPLSTSIPHAKVDGGGSPTSTSEDADASTSAEPLAGTWSGPYDFHVSAACPTDDVGTLTVTFGASGPTTIATAARFTAMQVYQPPCTLVGTADGTADGAIDTAGPNAATLSGTWVVTASGSPSWLPFSATRSGHTVTGAWTCPDCKGNFTLTKLD